MRGTRAETRERGGACLSLSVTAKWIQRGGRREKDGEGEGEDGNENGGGGVTEMFRRQTMDAPFVRSFVRHSLARKETRGMLHSKEGAAAAAAEEWKRRGRRCCYGTIDARYLRKKDGRSGAEGRESRFLSRCSVALSPEKRERLTGQQRRRFVTVASPSSSSSLYPRDESHTRHPLDSGAGGQGQLRSQRESRSFLPGGEVLFDAMPPI